MRGTAYRIFSIARKASSRTKKRSHGRVLTRGHDLTEKKKKKALLQYNSHTMQFTHIQCLFAF